MWRFNAYCFNRAVYLARDTGKLPQKETRQQKSQDTAWTNTWKHGPEKNLEKACWANTGWKNLELQAKTLDLILYYVQEKKHVYKNKTADTWLHHQFSYLVKSKGVATVPNSLLYSTRNKHAQYMKQTLILTSADEGWRGDKVLSIWTTNHLLITSLG